MVTVVSAARIEHVREFAKFFVTPAASASLPVSPSPQCVRSLRCAGLMVLTVFAADKANGGIDKDWDFHADIPDKLAGRYAEKDVDFYRAL